MKRIPRKTPQLLVKCTVFRLVTSAISLMAPKKKIRMKQRTLGKL